MSRPSKWIPNEDLPEVMVVEESKRHPATLPDGTLPPHYWGCMLVGDQMYFPRQQIGTTNKFIFTKKNKSDEFFPSVEGQLNSPPPPPSKPSPSKQHNKKRPPAPQETGREAFERIKAAGEAKKAKAVVRKTKKEVKAGKQMKMKMFLKHNMR